jgi:hypothetical protein
MKSKNFCPKCEKIIQRRIKELKRWIRSSGGKKAAVNEGRLFIITQLEWLLEEGC